MKQERAVSLLECMVALALMAALLGSMAVVFQGQFRLERSLAVGSELRSAQRVLLQLSGELKGVERVLQPTVGQQSAKLVIERISPSEEMNRLPWPIPDLPITGWSATSPSHRQQVTYEVQQFSLVRVTGSSVDTLLESVTNLQFRLLTDGELRVELQRSLQGKQQTERMLVALHP